MLRFSLKWFLAAVSFVALVTAALLYSRLVPLLAATVFGSLVIAAIRASVAGSRNLPFATGYAITGVAVLVILNANPEWGDFRVVRTKINEYIATPVHSLLVPVFIKREFALWNDVHYEPNGFRIGNTVTYVPHLDVRNTETTVRLTLAVLLGYLGGGLATAFKKRDGHLLAATGPSS